jgi:hypothetical protein
MLGPNDTTPLKSFSLTTTISKAELCSFLREPLAGESFFNMKGGLAEPLYSQKIAALQIIGAFEDCALQIFVGIDLKEIVLEPVTLKSLIVEPLTGGRSTFKCQVQYRPSESDDLRELERWLTHDVKAAVTVGKVPSIEQKQPELPMNDASDTPLREQLGAAAPNALCIHGVKLADDCADCDAVSAGQRTMKTLDDEEHEAARQRAQRERDIALQIERDRGSSMDSALGDGQSTQALLSTKEAKRRGREMAESAMANRADEAKAKKARPSRSKAAIAEREAAKHATH